MKFLDTLEHYCIKSTIVNEHKVPRLQECPKCSLKLHDKIATRINQPTEGAICPDCGTSMVKWPDTSFGEVHADLCLDKGMHYPQWLKEGKITAAEYNEWFASLTDREKMGFYEERERSVHLCVQLNPEEMALETSDPEQFKKLLQIKLEARAELSLHHDYQHRAKATTRRLQHHVEHIKKEPSPNK